MKIETKKDREARAALITEARQITELAERENKELTAEENTKIDKLLGDALALEKKITRNERLNDLTAEQEETLRKQAEDKDNPADQEAEAEKHYAEVFWKYQRKGEKGMKAEEMNLLVEKTNLRVQQTDTDASGGYLIEKEFSRRLDVALLEFGGMREVAEILRTGTGATMPYPTVDGTAQKGKWLSEGSAVTATDIVFGSTDFEAWVASSDLIKVSKQLLQDSFFDLPSFLVERLVERIGRLTNEDYTTGSGTGQPHGIVGAATVGKTAASPIAITMDELFDLKHSVDPAYRRNAKWMFNDTTMKVIAKLKDSDNRYLWNPDVQTGVAGMLLGHGYVVNNEVANIAASAKPVLFGDFSKYKIRDVLGFTLLRLEELYAANLQVGFVGFLRTDGKLVDAGTNPVKVLANPAS